MAERSDDKTKLNVIIVAAGASSRMGGEDKQFAELGGMPVVEHSLRTFAQCEMVERIALVVSGTNADRGLELVSDPDYEKAAACVPSGPRRQDSVRAGMVLLEDIGSRAEYVAVHDGARPFVDRPMIERGLAAAQAVGAAVAAVPVNDTIKSCGSNGIVTETLDRDALRAAQTPQVFRTDVLRAAHDSVTDDVTDDASMVEKGGGLVAVFDGDKENIKITTPDDLVQARLIAARRTGVDPLKGQQRWGTGFDGHRLTLGGPLRLGGVDVPFDRRLEGHSDGDVLMHAVASAILGAAALGGLGSHFPPNDEKNAGMDSAIILRRCAEMALDRGWVVSHLDATIVAQRPRLSGHLDEMAAKIAKAAKIERAFVNVKVTSTDAVGAIGAGQGIAAQAVATLSKSAD